MRTDYEMARLLNNVAAILTDPQQRRKVLGEAVGVLQGSSNGCNEHTLRANPSCKDNSRRLSTLVTIPDDANLPLSTIAAVVLFNYGLTCRDLPLTYGLDLFYRAHAALLKEGTPKCGSFAWRLLGVILRELAGHDERLTLQYRQWTSMSAQGDMPLRAVAA